MNLRFLRIHRSSNTIVKLGIKELLNKEQTGFKELFIDYQLKKTFVGDPVLNLEWVEILYGTHSNINEQLEERNIWLWATILRWTKTSLLPSLTVYNKSFLLSSAARNCMQCPHCFRVHNWIQIKVQNSIFYYLFPHFEKYLYYTYRS